MKTAALITALTIVLAGSAFAQTVSPTDKVLFDRATAFVKGLRDGKSWNKTIAELKKDFPDMKELEPFRAIEGSEVFAREFGALYSFDTDGMARSTGYKCDNFPQIQFSFYQDKLYRFEVFYYKERPEMMSKIATSFFSTTETNGRYGSGRAVSIFSWTSRYGNVRVTPVPVKLYNYRTMHGCEYISSKSSESMAYTQKFTFTASNIEKQFYADQNLLHPDWGYSNIKWDSSLQEVYSNYKNLVETSEEDSIFGLISFVQKNKDGGDIKERTFRFFQDSLFEVTVEYANDAYQERALAKLKLMYREDVHVRKNNRGDVIYSNPLKNEEYVSTLIARAKEKRRNDREKYEIGRTGL